MKRRLPVPILVLAVLGLAAAGFAQDPPHWASVATDIDCTSQCHVPHAAPGGTLTAAAGNVNLCQSCHRPLGLAEDLSIANVDKAVRGVSGTSHAFDVPAVNAELDTQRPIDTEMDLRVMGDNIVCSTCHDQHKSLATTGGTPRVGNARKITALGSPDPGLASGGVYGGPEGVWYLVEITRGDDETRAEFCYSKDNGISWFPTGCNPPGTLDPNLRADAGNPVTLDNGVTVTFEAGTYVAGERWEFAASWPFLRAALGAGGSNLCAQCHGQWVMDHTAVESWNNGAIKSHPVGVALNANSQGYDRAVPLDGDGNPQGGAGDGNPSNDLTLYDSPNDVVQCLTCHGVHFVDSNTETVDGPS